MDVFVSYRSTKQEKATELRELLVSNGFTVWMAPDSIKGGQDYMDELVAAIKGSGVVLSVLSKDVHSSDWVRLELKKAFDNKKYIIPYYIEDFKLSENYEGYMTFSHCIYEYKNITKAKQELLDAVSSALDRTPDLKKHKETSKQAKEEKNSGEANAIVEKRAADLSKDTSTDAELTKDTVIKSTLFSYDEEKDFYYRHVLNGKEIIYSDGSKYLGEESFGKPYGRGFMVLSNGRVYEGNFKDGMFHGVGKLFYENGDVYEGTFAEGKFDGNGKFSYIDGVLYKGEFENGKVCGKGRYQYNENEYFEGEFKDDLSLNSRLVLSYVNGDYYEGIGKYVEYCGNIYEGEFKSGKRNGKGKYTFANGDVYEGEGEIEFGFIQGKGKYSFVSGDVYEGELYAGKPHGKGQLICRDGSLYKGKFRDGYFDGYGTYTDANGVVTKGIYRRGKLYRKLWY